jgi:hypothetical protein
MDYCAEPCALGRRVGGGSRADTVVTTGYTRAQTNHGAGRVALVLREWEANMRTATVVAVISIALSVTGPAAAQVDRSDTEHDRTILTLKSRQ